jgi:hypothetical protein
MNMTKPVAPATPSAEPRVTLAKLAGSFVYRFSGPAMQNAISYQLMGIGQFQLDQQGNLSGNHKYSILALQGQAANLLTGAYRLKGQLLVDGDGTGSATIQFTSTQGQGRDLDGQFHVLVAETVDRLWFVSSGATLSNGEPAQELASLEAIRVLT